MGHLQHITLTTSDGVRLASDWYQAIGPNDHSVVGRIAQTRGWALLLHMMPATKESYAGLAAALAGQGIASLAFDQRGHGGSDGGPKGYEAFTDAQQQAKRLDVDAGIAYLVGQGMTPDRLVVVGASIGANLALQYLAEHHDVPAAVLLSPGMDYRGVFLAPLAERIAPQQRVLLAAGGSDDAYSTETVAELAEMLGDRATVRTFTRAGHGTTMLEREPEFLREVVQWVAARMAT